MAEKARKTEKVRRPLAEVKPFIDLLTEELPDPVDVEWHFGGSYKRGAPMIGDLDVMIVLPDGILRDDLLPKSFQPESKGDKKAMGNLALPDGSKMHLDIWVCTPKERGAFLMFIEGPYELNVAQRSRAKTMGYNLSQIGLLKDGVQVDNGTEYDIYRILEMQWLTPEQRQAFAAPQGDDVVEKIVEGSKGAKYTVKIKGNSVSCNCPGYRYRRNCKHADSARESVGAF